jgi:hypothetical protein
MFDVEDCIVYEYVYKYLRMNVYVVEKINAWEGKPAMHLFYK